jgi:ABC-type multidrug transport system ATPase subunit
MLRGISGGEAKRVNVGIALITSPSVLFLDELTSGLDSHTAHGVVKVVKEVVGTTIAAAATIHSPPPYTFALFERVMVLQRGREVYWGPNGKCTRSCCRHSGRGV